MSDEVRARLEQGNSDSTNAASALVNIANETDTIPLALGRVSGSIDELLADLTELKLSAKDALGGFNAEATNLAKSGAEHYTAARGGTGGDELIGSSSQLANDLESWAPGPMLADAIQTIIDVLASAQTNIEPAQGVAATVKETANQHIAKALSNIGMAEEIIGRLPPG